MHCWLSETRIPWVETNIAHDALDAVSQGTRWVSANLLALLSAYSVLAMCSG